MPGVTDADSIEDWDLPFATADKIRPEDDDYWDHFRTTPKAFINLASAQELFKSRFGDTTSFRLPAETGDLVSVGSGSRYSGVLALLRRDAVADKLMNQFTESDAELGLQLVPIKRRGLAASSGSTPFDVLFLALSMFVIGSALILVSLLFR